MQRDVPLRRQIARLDPRRPMIRATLPGLLLGVLGVTAVAGLLDAVREADDISLFDRPVLAWLVDNRGAMATTVLRAITLVSGPLVLPAGVAVACLAWGRVRRQWWRPLLLVGAMAGSSVLSLAVKGLVARPRPTRCSSRGRRRLRPSRRATPLAPRPCCSSPGTWW